MAGLDGVVDSHREVVVEVAEIAVDSVVVTDETEDVIEDMEAEVAVLDEAIRGLEADLHHRSDRAHGTRGPVQGVIPSRLLPDRGLQHLGRRHPVRPDRRHQGSEHHLHCDLLEPRQADLGRLFLGVDWGLGFLSSLSMKFLGMKFFVICH